MGRPNRSVVLSLVVGFLFSAWGRSGEAVAGEWLDKVDPWVLSTADAEGSAEFLVFLREQASLREAALLTSKEEKGEFVSRTLREAAERTQAPVLSELKSLAAEFRPYWIANMVWVRGDLEVVRMMAERDDVLRVSANPNVPLQKIPPEPPRGLEAPDAIEWGITKTGAPSAWALGFKGNGVVVGGQDTGYDWDHPALKTRYRGWNGSVASHDYNWHDAIHSGGGVCGANSPVPCDDDEHGTHTMGTMVGSDGTNQIGMAPDAKWIGCRNMNQGNGTPASYSECFQWFVAPTNLAGLDPDPAKAPHVINNSWGCPPSEGCTDPLVLKTVVENTRAAGIVVVVSAGNSGSSCGSVSDPPAIYEASFAVGATDSSDGIASFSSRGAVTVDGSGRLKPDVSAPGVGIRSSVPGGGYASFSGTSMAGPHVAGHVALLLSARPQWKGQVGLVEDRIALSAVPRTSAQTCGGIPGSEIPNNTFGWGRIDVLASVSITDVGIEIVDSPDPVSVGGTLTYIVRANNNAGVVPATDVVATVTLSPKVSFVSAPPECSHSSGVVTCAFGTIVKGSMPTKSIVTTVDSGGTIQTSGSVTGSLYDSNPGNNQVFATTSAGSGADLRLTMHAPWSVALAGYPVTYSLTVENLGPSAAGAVTVTDTLPAGSAFSTASAGCAHASGTVACSLGTLNAGVSSTVTVTVVPSAAPSMTNAAVVAGDVVDPSVTNNSASLTRDVVAAKPVGLGVDAHSGGGAGSDANGVFEPGERVVVDPIWENPSAVPADITGTVASFEPVSVSGGTYTIADAAASYGSLAAGASGDCYEATGDAYELEVPVPDARPAAHWDATVTETLSTGAEKTWTLHLGDSFTDVPRSHWAYPYVETILHASLTFGCGDAVYCPDVALTRAEMAAFLLRAIHGAGWVPPPPTGTVFTDVQVDHWAAGYIEELAAEGLTNGCAPSQFCPDRPVDRAEMAAFLLRARNGPGWVPPAPTGTVFTDVPISFWAAGYIEALAQAGITLGCAEGLYCPANPVNRAEMAAFLSRTFDLKLY